VSKPVPVTDGTFEAEVLEADRLVLTDFWAEWCMPCLMVEPILEEVAAEYADQLKVARIDVDSNSKMATRLGIMSIPTLILFKNGQPVERLVGAMRKRSLLERIKPYLT